jgi:WD40 repeat protein
LTDAALSADELMLVSCGRDGTVQLWDSKGNHRTTFHSESGASFERVDISSKRAFVAAATNHYLPDHDRWDSQIYVWSVKDGQLHRHWEIVSIRCKELAFSPDERELAVAGSTAPLLVNLESGEQRMLASAGLHISDCAYSPDGRQLIGISHGENQLWLWDLDTGKIRRILSPHRGSEVVRFFPTSQHILSAGIDDLKLWNVGDDSAPPQLREPAASCRLSFAEDGQQLIGETSNRRISIWDLSNRRRLHDLGPELRRITFSRRANVIAAARKNDVVLYSATSGQRIHTLHGHTRPVELCHIGESGALVASGDEESDDPADAILWDGKTGKLKHRMPGHYRAVRSVAVAPDDRTVFTVDGTCDLRIWDVATGNLLLTTKEHRKAWGSLGVTRIVFNGDGTSLYACAVGGVQEIDPVTGKMRRNLAIGTISISDLCVSPDGRTLAVSRGKLAPHDHDEGVVELWDLASGELMTTLAKQHGSAICVAFSPDGRTLATGHRNGTIALWQAATDEEVRRQAPN